MPFRAPGGLIIHLEPFYIDVPKKTMRSTFLYARYQTEISAASAVNDVGYALWQVYPFHANANLRTSPAKPTRPYRRRPVPVYVAVGSCQTFATPLWCTYQVSLVSHIMAATMVCKLFGVLPSQGIPFMRNSFLETSSVLSFLLIGKPRTGYFNAFRRENNLCSATPYPSH